MESGTIAKAGAFQDPRERDGLEARLATGLSYVILGHLRRNYEPFPGLGRVSFDDCWKMSPHSSKVASSTHPRSSTRCRVHSYSTTNFAPRMPGVHLIARCRNAFALPLASQPTLVAVATCAMVSRTFWRGFEARTSRFGALSGPWVARDRLNAFTSCPGFWARGLSRGDVG